MKTMRPTFLLSLAVLSLATGAVQARPADPKPAPIPKEQIPAAMTAPFPSIAFEGLKLVKDPRGGVTASDNSFTVNSIAFGMENTVNIGPQSSGVGAGKAIFTPVTFRRVPDANSAEFLRALAIGRPFTRATIRLKGGVLVTLGLVAVSSYHIEMSGEQPIETVTLAVGQIDFRMVNYAEKSTLGILFSWDMVRNTAKTEMKVDIMPQ